MSKVYYVNEVRWNSYSFLKEVDYYELLDLLMLPANRCLNSYDGVEPRYAALVRSEAFKEFLNRCQRSKLTNNKPIEKGSSLVMIGSDSAFEYRKLKERLAPLGIEMTVKVIPNETTHILMSANPKTLKGLDDILISEVTIISDHALQAALDRLEQPYLKSEEDTTDNQQNLEAMLLSKNEENIIIAMQIISSGGLPKSLITPLFIAFKQLKNIETKTLAKKILQRHLKHPLKATLRLDYEMTEKRLSENLVKYGRQNPWLDTNLVIALLYQYYGVGYHYIFKHCTDTQLIDKVLQEHLQDETLDLRDKGIDVLPKQIKNYKQIKFVEVSGNNFKAMPRAIANMPNITHLNISNSRFLKITSALQYFQHLTNVNLKNVYNRVSIKDIALLENLKKLTISKHGLRVEVEDIKWLKGKLPDVEVIIS